jgi:hypothetical protein
MGWFVNLFAKRLFAQEAFIEELAAQVITLKSGGLIRSEGTDPATGRPLFSLKANGEFEAANANIKGRIKADSGTLSNVTVNDTCNFFGRIDAGPLKVQPSQSVPFNGTSDKYVNDFAGEVLTAFGVTLAANQSFAFSPASGAYRGQVLGSVEVFANRDNGAWYVLNMYAPNGSIIGSEGQTQAGAAKIQYPFSFTAGAGGFNLRLVGLPPSATVPGEVYGEDDGSGNYYLKIKK